MSAFCEPLDLMMESKEPRQGRKRTFFRPCQGSFTAKCIQGFAALTPGYYLIII